MTAHVRSSRKNTANKLIVLLRFLLLIFIILNANWSYGHAVYVDKVGPLLPFIYWIENIKQDEPVTVSINGKLYEFWGECEYRRSKETGILINKMQFIKPLLDERIPHNVNQNLP